MKILGISAFYHDSAACLVDSGEIVAAAQEERFTRKKHDEAFPAQAVSYCLGEAGIAAKDLDLVVFYDKPWLKFDRLLETWLGYVPRSFRQFTRGLPLWLGQKLHVPRELDRGLGGAYRGRYAFTSHHESHAASAFFPSPFEEAAILTLDGVGEWATGSLGIGRGNAIELLQELRFPHSLGLLYSAFTYFTGFKVNSGEYKLMGLAPYGEPRFADVILRELVDLRDDGSFRLDMRYFAYAHGEVMTSPAMDVLFEGPPRKAEAPLTSREMDLAASIQAVTEEIVLRIARHAHARTGQKNLVMAGGVALNCVANGRLLREGPFERIWIQPAAGDAGGALGAALFAWHQLVGEPRTPRSGDAQKGSLLGPAYSNDEVGAFLDSVGAVYERFDDEASLCEQVAELLADEKVVGHAAGRMEFGPRALGARSILGDPRSAQMQSVMNLKIKFRESFRPFAPAVLREHVHEYFDMRPNEDSPYMLLVAPVREDKRVACEGGVRGLERLQQVRSVVPAITHVDGSARVQTVDESRHPRFAAILRAFERKTGMPMLINTSFNVRGEPIVCTPADAWRCFLATGMDALVIESFVMVREAQPQAERFDREAHLSQFALD
ncbi:MAG: carbamoyltransferase [Sandaracinus sp.]|nr:carbamoyltransferase [Sandaracinus sp.]MCB9620555.1 carbamoyltransferase [Sandaracinus sp.]MCB9631392.1 carbamoyltransferase [Sandaracinus sp.]